MFYIGYLSILLMITTTSPASAYIDPGLGSILLQSLVAVIAAVSMTLGHYWHRIKSIFRSDSSMSEPTGGTAKDPD